MTSGHVGPPTGRGVADQGDACLLGRTVDPRTGHGHDVIRGWSWNSDAGSDIKICQLYDPIGDRLGYFGYRGYDSDWEDKAPIGRWLGFPYDISLTAMSRGD